MCEYNPVKNGIKSLVNNSVENPVPVICYAEANYFYAKPLYYYINVQQVI